MSALTPEQHDRLRDAVARALHELAFDLAGWGPWQPNSEAYREEAEAAIQEARLDDDPPKVDPVRLQRAMREAHGKRGRVGETYAEAIARRYNADR